MKNNITFFRGLVKGTSTLLIIGAVLAVLGVFDGMLGWDIFSKSTEKFLTAVFACCMVLAGFGFALCVVQGMKSSVIAMRQLAKIDDLDIKSENKKSNKAYIYSLLIMIVIVFSFNLGNQIILKHRTKVFKRITQEQLQVFDDKIINILDEYKNLPVGTVPQEFYDLIYRIEGFEFIYTATIYLPDPSDKNSMWGFRSWRRHYMSEDGFSKFFVIKSFEKAMKKAFSGSIHEIEKLNSEKIFRYYYLLKDKSSNVRAILRIEGNSKEDFREY